LLPGKGIVFEGREPQLPIRILYDTWLNAWSYVLAYWLTADRSVDRACVFAIADFMINPARAGMQTHMDSMDFFRLPPSWFSEPIAATTTKATATRANRFMGLTSLMDDTEAVSWEFLKYSITQYKGCFFEAFVSPVAGEASSLIDFTGLAVL